MFLALSGSRNPKPSLLLLGNHSSDLCVVRVHYRRWCESERKRERERHRDERGTLAGERGRKRWRRKYTIRTSTPAPFFFHALSPYKHTLHCGARLTCFDSPSSLSVFSLPQFQLLGLKEWGMCLAAKLLGENIWCLIDRGWSKRLVIWNYPKSWDCVCVHVSVSVCERDLLPGVVCECS